MNFFESIKDFFYDIADYIIIIGIIGIVVFVISWRLDLLFAKDALDLPSPNIELADKEDVDPSLNEESPDDSDDSMDVKDSEEDQDLEKGEQEAETEGEQKPETITGDKNVKETVKITIPSGSLPSKIGTILEDNGLITSSMDFIRKSQDLKLDTKLRSGVYEIESGSSLEEIVKIIAHK